MFLPRRVQSGGIIIMGLVGLLIIVVVSALIWYAFNGGEHIKAPSPPPSETEIIIH